MFARVPQQVGVAFALCAFMVSLGSGLVSGADSTQVLIRSLVVLFGAAAIGRVLGVCVRIALDEHLAMVTQANTIPEPIPVPHRGVTEHGDVEILEDTESP